MAVIRIGLFSFLGILLSCGSGINAQAFLAEPDGTRLTLGYPDSLSSACQVTFNTSTQCNSALGAIAFDALFPSSEQLAVICTDDCLGSLQNFRSQQAQSCESESYAVDGQLVPATYNVDQLLFTYSYTCLQDPPTKDYCAPLVDQWSEEGPTSEQSCSDCMLRTFQVELNSPFGYDDEFADYYRSLTSSCGVLDYPITSPPPYTVTRTPTPTSSHTSSPTPSCASYYTVREGDDCLSVSKAQRVSAAMLRYENGLTADCTNWPDVGTSLCIPAPCELYTLQANETCYGISQAHNTTFTVTQLISWNPDINRDCSNLEAIIGTQLCISAPGDTAGPEITTIPAMTTAVPTPAPSNVANGTDLQCAKYYEVAPGDTCASLTVMMGISLTDFYFLNPEVKKANCTNLQPGSSYCVQAVGDIATYTGYGGKTDPCMTIPIPISCLATGPVTTDTAWTFPTYTTTKTPQTTSLPLAPGTLTNCSAYAEYLTSPRNTTTINSCYVVASFFDEDVENFVSWNPSLSYDPGSPGNCQLQPGYQYCARVTGYTTTSTPTPTSAVTSTTSTQSPTSTGANGAPTPLPIQPGMTSNCGKFYLVQLDDGCEAIATAHGISLADFYAWNAALNGDCSDRIALSDLYSWNPALNGDCSGLWPDYYICVGRGESISASSVIPTTTTTTTAAANVTPTPTQAGMVSGCKSFYLVQSGDGCYDIAASHGITLDQFYSYNPSVGGDCGGLWPTYYVCVGVEA
ncbi:uncharacterized protein ATNIH1004_001637 [Aspergillus tanneri]|uniref:LysM domain-containing protein n=1 Tax=Aspergillus tanneri TaxID=1220188 RepID=A0A5M9N060_9EURO|nr:uncharacterized protein ATNIH1004_001637 [Aspergillus tanneri]KAA8652732.1 hypothetical protein ATNIH1004_001637 [Aspergillus tanneri]